MKRAGWLLIVLLLGGAARGQAWRQPPHVGYVYPAGGRAGRTVEVTVGGQYLSGQNPNAPQSEAVPAGVRVRISGVGMKAEVVDYLHPPGFKEISKIREYLQQARKQVQAEAKAGKRGGRLAVMRRFLELARAGGITDRQLEAFNKWRRQRQDPKAQVNPQLSESLKVRLTIAADAEPGTCELRVMTPMGLSNPVQFYIDRLRETSEVEPNNHADEATPVGTLPAVLNGQITPGDVDRWRFHAKASQQIVAKVSARALIPYLADAVPGWFQAAAALYDAEGRRVAFDDDWRFDPDPVLVYKVPRDGDYVLEIRDALYRGRDDFVYRVALGELPFVTSVFPLAARPGEHVEVQGVNLQKSGNGKSEIRNSKSERNLKSEIRNRGTSAAADAPSSVVPKAQGPRPSVASAVPPASLESEPNDDAAHAKKVTLPAAVNGRIDRVGDWDVYRFHADKGEAVVAEVYARRLGSPLDSLLKLTDATGRVLALNDDHPDPAAGLETHHADSRLEVTIPSTGDYLVWIGDTQHKGGRAYAYRLDVAPPRPDFALRVTPSAVNVRPGDAAVVTVYALRRDGFAGRIDLRLEDAAPGFVLSGGWIPAGQDKVALTLEVPVKPAGELTPLRLEGVATVAGRRVVREAVPADDMMQAFAYHHLVVAADWTAAVAGPRVWGPGWQVDADGPVQLTAGGTTRIRIRVRRPAAARRFLLELADPPEGITLESVTPTLAGLDVALRVDAGKAKPGLRGNLIFNASVLWTPRPRNGDDKKPPAKARRVPAGTLPAIPFEVVSP